MNVEMLLRKLHESRTAWASLSQISIDPKVAFKVAKYQVVEIEPTLKVISDEFNKLVKEFNTQPEGEPEGVEPETTKRKQFDKKWGMYLEQIEEVKQSDVTMDELVDAISKNKNNHVSNAVLISLMPFFSDKDTSASKRRSSAKKRN